MSTGLMKRNNENLFSPFFKDNVFDRFLTDPFRSIEVNDYSAIAKKDNGNSITYGIDMPGVEKKDLSVKVHDGMISIDWTKNVLDTETKGSRRFTIPDNLDQTNLDAKLEGGILYLTIDKVPEAQEKIIEVK